MPAGSKPGPPALDRADTFIDVPLAYLHCIRGSLLGLDETILYFPKDHIFSINFGKYNL